ncbi:MAG: hypothetical protein OIN83_09465 [Candidatus Methanoperedens sp.]|nr:hypothetical protein [Candidatus Methanoperedens sp.]
MKYSRNTFASLSQDLKRKLSLQKYEIIKAKFLWPCLEPVLSAAVSRVIQSANGGKMVPASFGVGRRQSGSSVKPEATITEAADAVINEDESHREVIRTLESPGFSR